VSAWFTAIRADSAQLGSGSHTVARHIRHTHAMPVAALLLEVHTRASEFQLSSTPFQRSNYSIHTSGRCPATIHDQERYCEELNIELMRIDAWLSYVGRTDKISNGPTDLLKGAPALVQLLQADFEVDFMNIDLSAKEGGHQDIQGLTDNVMDFLTDEELDEVEQLYILVALLRAVKVCQCLLAGSNTREMDEILMKDVQAHLV
jgi:hypothetical protein